AAGGVVAALGQVLLRGRIGRHLARRRGRRRWLRGGRRRRRGLLRRARAPRERQQQHQPRHAPGTRAGRHPTGSPAISRASWYTADAYRRELLYSVIALKLWKIIQYSGPDAVSRRMMFARASAG